MPYIAKERRVLFKESINAVLESTRETGRSFYQQVDLINYFFVGFIEKHLFGEVKSVTQFSHTISESNRKKLIQAINSVSMNLDSSDPLKSCGEINYVLTSVILGFFGQDNRFAVASYGQRAYVEGILIDLIDVFKRYFNICSKAMPKNEFVLKQRKLTCICGAIKHASLELYRKNTSLYEDEKIEQNGEVWFNSELV